VVYSENRNKSPFRVVYSENRNKSPFRVVHSENRKLNDNQMMVPREILM